MSTTQARPNFWHNLALKTRFAHARLKKGTVRFKTSNLASVYAAYEERGIAYVVLRWAAEVPMEQSEESGYTKDVDHLIAAKDVMAALDVSSAYPGKIKCDYYSAEGRSGTSYNGMPYYQPARALSILARRSRDPRGFYRPCLEDEFFAFAYHLCYHKGHRAGIPTGTDVAPDTDAPRDYLAELKRLAIKAQRNDLHENITLLGLHHYLVRNKWGMPYDLMLRWPDSHPFMEALTCFEEAAMEEDCPLAKDLTIIVLRDDCDSPELEEIARQKIAERFTIGQEIRLDGAARERVIQRTRGGNWNEKGREETIGPTLAFLCRNAPEPGPLPDNMSAAKVAKRYPQVHHTDVLIKRAIRAAINKVAPTSFSRAAIHATDNPMEAVKTLRAILDDKARAFLKDFAKGPR